jgi:hypothetical protein
MSSDVCQCSDEPHDMCVAVSHAVRCSTAPCRAVQVACCAVLRWVVLGGGGGGGEGLKVVCVVCSMGGVLSGV